MLGRDRRPYGGGSALGFRDKDLLTRLHMLFQAGEPILDGLDFRGLRLQDSTVALFRPEKPVKGANPGQQGRRVESH